MTRAEHLAAAKAVRLYIHNNPGKTRIEIEAETGITGVIMTLQMKRLIRPEGNPPKYFSRPQ